jgi:uncharacterized protein YceK
MKKIILISLVLFLLSGCAGTLTSGSASFPGTRAATGRRVFIYDPKYHAWAAYDESGKLVNTGRATGGKLYCPDIGRPCKTVVGRYHILSKGDVNCKSSKYPVETRGGAPMPFCMLFHPKGYAIHGTPHVPSSLNSHGCIGVSYTDARWLAGFLHIGSTVLVRSYRA